MEYVVFMQVCSCSCCFSLPHYIFYYGFTLQVSMPEVSCFKVSGFNFCLIFSLIILSTPTMGFNYVCNNMIYYTDRSIETYCKAFDRLRCENGGYPVDTGHGFACKCTDDYYGELCTYGTYAFLSSENSEYRMKLLIFDEHQNFVHYS